MGFHKKKMVKRCIYCNSDISTDSVVDICKPCMHQVWGEKMSQAIIGGMEKERDKGNLELGEVSNSVGVEERKTELENNAFNLEEKAEICEQSRGLDEVDAISDTENIENIDNLFSEQNTENAQIL